MFDRVRQSNPALRKQQLLLIRGRVRAPAAADPTPVLRRHSVDFGARVDEAPDAAALCDPRGNLRVDRSRRGGEGAHVDPAHPGHEGAVQRSRRRGRPRAWPAAGRSERTSTRRSPFPTGGQPVSPPRRCGSGCSGPPPPENQESSSVVAVPAGRAALHGRGSSPSTCRLSLELAEGRAHLGWASRGRPGRAAKSGPALNAVFASAAGGPPVAGEDLQGVSDKRACRGRLPGSVDELRRLVRWSTGPGSVV